jgi:antitoxin component of RelBE/YafQ-DinJ toxin-antitoxin module
MEKKIINDNLKAAMDKVVETISMGVSPIANKEDDGPAGAQVLIRTTPEEKDRWKRAAEKEGITLSQLFRETMNKRATEILDCIHPMEYRKTFPWSEFCLKCDTRLR